MSPFPDPTSRSHECFDPYLRAAWHTILPGLLDVPGILSVHVDPMAGCFAVLGLREAVFNRRSIGTSLGIRTDRLVDRSTHEHRHPDLLDLLAGVGFSGGDRAETASWKAVSDLVIEPVHRTRHLHFFNASSRQTASTSFRTRSTSPDNAMGFHVFAVKIRSLWSSPAPCGVGRSNTNSPPSDIRRKRS